MKFFHVYQHDISDCGAACLLTVLKQYGYDMPIGKIRKFADTDRKGTTAFGIVKAARKIGFSAKGVEIKKTDLLKYNIIFPAISHVILENNWEHYVVIHKVDGNKILISDPAKGIIEYNAEEFFEIWDGILILMEPTEKIKENTKNHNNLIRFFKLAFPYKKILAKVFILSLILTLIGVATSFYFSYAVDNIIPTKNYNLLFQISVFTVILFTLKGVLGLCRNKLMLYLSKNLDEKLITDCYNHMINLPIEFYENRKTGDITSRFSDASKIREALSSAILTIMIDFVMVICGGGILFTQSHSLFSIVIIMVIIYAFTIIGFNKKIKKANRIQMENNGVFSSYLTETIIGFETIKATQYEGKAKQRLKKLHNNLLESVFKAGTITNIQQFVSELIFNIGSMLVITIGIIKVLEGSITIGDLIAFNALLIYFFEPIKNLMQLQPMMQTAIAASERLDDILDLETELITDDNVGCDLSVFRSDIVISDLVFSYGMREPVLKGINLSISAGEKIAFIGESGSGKTTLAKLLLKFLNTSTGNIYFGEQNINEINTSSLRGKIGYVSQNTFLLNDSIIENIRMGNTDLSLEDVEKVCEYCKLTDFINSLPLKYNTTLKENGCDLSSGQRQRIALARVLAKKPDILILDEATSHLDAITEDEIRKIIDNIAPKITTINIAHRLHTVMDSDKIFVLDKGVIVESGSHSELLERKGKYYEMWQKQHL